MKTTHVIAKMKGSEEILLDNSKIKNKLLESAWENGVSVITNSCHEFYPQGLSFIILLAESHISIHTYPELGFCDLDCYTCGDKIDGSKIMSLFAQKMGLSIENLKELER